MDDKQLQYYEQYYFTNELPVPFKVKNNNYLIYINPVKVKMYPFYRDNVGILHIEKNRINDAKIISMSYLQYLIEVLLPQSEQAQNQLVTMLHLSIGDEYIYTTGHDEKGKVYLGIQKDGETLCRITPKEFDKIREIIFYYNDREYDDRYISDDMQKAMQEYYNLKYKNNYIPTLEEKKAFVSFKSGLTLAEINEMSYRYFEIIYRHCIDNDLFFSQTILQASEKYKVNDVVYPLFKKKSGKFDFLQNADTFKNQVSAMAKA